MGFLKTYEINRINIPCDIGREAITQFQLRELSIFSRHHKFYRFCDAPSGLDTGARLWWHVIPLNALITRPQCDVHEVEARGSDVADQ
jgi:hypothetical protein